MSALDERAERLRKAYPEAPSSALLHLPRGFEADAAKAGAFIRTWTAVLDLASMLEKRVEALGKTYGEPFPGIAGPDFKELGQKHSQAFLRQIGKAASVDGKVSNELLYGAFGDELEKVRKLEKDVKEFYLVLESDGLSQGRRHSR
jgi:hypothetical protein